MTAARAGMHANSTARPHGSGRLLRGGARLARWTGHRVDLQQPGAQGSVRNEVGADQLERGARRGALFGRRLPQIARGSRERQACARGERGGGHGRVG